MFATISNIFKVADLRTKIVFTLLMLVVFRIGAFIPVPNVNADVLNFQDQANAFSMISIFGGGALENFSIFAMGIMPYITASIIVQLLTMDVVPKFAQWAREGEAGKRKLAQVTRYGTVVLGFIQAFGMSIGFNNMFPGLVVNPSFMTYLFITLVLTAGTAFLMWLGELITEKGIGNGISILIFAGIVAGFPTAVNQFWIQEATKVADGSPLFLSIIFGLILILVVIAVIVGVIFIQQGIRKIPVQYAKRVVGRKMYGGQSTHIPLKVNAAGVIPVIFAMSLLMFPSTIASFWAGSSSIAQWITTNFSYESGLGMFFYILLIIGFTYFYTFVQMNPVQMAENMKKNGGYIPGIRPGKTTSVYLTRILNRLTLAGSLFLAAVSILPFIIARVGEIPAQVQIGGTALLIVVGVALDTMKQINSQLIKRHYKGFIK